MCKFWNAIYKPFPFPPLKTVNLKEAGKSNVIIETPLNKLTIFEAERHHFMSVCFIANNTPPDCSSSLSMEAIASGMLWGDGSLVRSC